MPHHRLLLLTNSAARWGARADDAAERLKGHGFEVIHRTPTDQAATLEVLRRQGPQVDIIVIGGGDGTISAAAPALLEIQKPLAILPMGTANDLAASLGLPGELEACIDLIKEGERQRIDLGRINGRPYFNAVSIGLGARVAALHRGERKRRLGVLNYPLVLVSALRHLHPVAATILCDEQRIEGRFLHIAIVNGRHHGGWLTAHEAASLHDGCLDLYALRPLPLLRLATLLPALRSGRRAGNDIVRLKGRHVEIHTRRRRYNVDGELAVASRLIIDLLPAALEVFVPRRA